MSASVERRPTAPRPAIRSVGLPSEHGGWGLTLEPGVLGLLVAPSVAGACLAAAAILAFLARTPLKIVLVDRRRRRSLPRTALARRVAAVELAVLAALVGAAFALAEPWFWIPAAVAAPLILVESWFDVRSRGRRLVPELNGAIGVCSVVAMIVLANGHSAGLATALWIVLAARIVTSIPYVRGQISRLHGHPTSAAAAMLTDASAVALGGGAALINHRVLAGAVAVTGVVAIQRLTSRGPVPRPVVLGIRQLALGFGVVVATALGVLASAR